MAMVSIRPTSRNSNGHPTHRITFYAAVIAALALAGIYLLSLPKSGVFRGDAATGTASEEVVSPRTALMSSGVRGIDGGTGNSGDVSKNKEELDEEDVDPLTITEGKIFYDGNDLPYFHCGPLPSDDNPELTELVLLHGAAFKKEDWKKSGILDMLCDINNEEDEGNLSISAK